MGQNKREFFFSFLFFSLVVVVAVFDFCRLLACKWAGRTKVTFTFSENLFIHKHISISLGQIEYPGKDSIYRKDIYIYYIHPELRIGNCCFCSGKGARPLQREHRGSRGEHIKFKREVKRHCRFLILSNLSTNMPAFDLV